MSGDDHDHASIDELVGWLGQASGYTGTVTAPGPDDLTIRAGVRVEYTEPAGGGAYHRYRGIVVTAHTADYRHVTKVEGAEDLRDAIDQAIAQVQASRGAARPAALTALASADRAFRAADETREAALVRRLDAVLAASEGGHSAGEIAGVLGVNASRAYQLIETAGRRRGGA